MGDNEKAEGKGEQVIFDEAIKSQVGPKTEDGRRKLLFLRTSDFGLRTSVSTTSYTYVYFA
jgi:hypothetical protein